MPTTAELRLMPGRQHGLIFLIDGCEIGFCNNAALVGYDTGAGHDIQIGLMRDISFTLALDLPSGQFDDSPASFTINDVDHVLDDLFKAFDDTAQDLGNVPFGFGLPITPSEDLTARTDLHGLNVGTERIGSAGERHRFSVPPGFTIGAEHSVTIPELELEGAPVSADPIVWKGRRCTLLRVYRDHVTYPDRTVGLTAWRPIDEAVLLWYGTLRDQAEISGREWKLKADGPESWLRKPLGIGFAREPVKAVGDVTLSDEEGNDERQVHVSLFADGASGYGTSHYVAPLTDGTVDEIRDQVKQIFVDAVNDAGVSGTWANEAGWKFSMADDGSVLIQVANGVQNGGQALVIMSRKVWSVLGYDVVEQPKFDQEPDEARAIQFAQVQNAYSDDYWGTYFHTGLASWPLGEDNNGAPRVWRPLYNSGTHTLLKDLNGGRGQIVRLADATLGAGASQSTVAHPGQLSRPVQSDPDDETTAISLPGLGACNRQGLWLFIGKRRYVETEEEFDEWWVGRACWVAGSGALAGLVAGDVIMVVEWLDASLFGFPRKKPNSDWVARVEEIDGEQKGMTYAVPICSLSYFQGGSLERADQVMQRLLLTTGTSSGWDAPSGDGPSLDAGDNEPAGVDYTGPEQTRDAERASLGLAIPESYVQPQGAWQREVDLVDDPKILEVKVAFSSGYQAEDVFRSLMQPVGWSWHLRGGRLGVFCPAHPLTLDDVEVVLDRSAKAKPYAQQEQEIASGERKVTAQKMRAYAPVDNWIANSNYAPHLNKTQEKSTKQAPDPGYRYRPGVVDRTIIAHHHRPPHFGTPWTLRVAYLAKWWALRHFIVEDYPVHLVDPGEDCWPGTIAALTDPELVFPNGTRGITNAICIIAGTRTNLRQGIKLLDLLLIGGRAMRPRLHGPIARAWGYDSATRRLYVRDNEFGIKTTDSDWSDAERFEEPLYAGIAQLGGDAIVVVKQWNGETFAQTLQGEVESVHTTPGEAYIQLASGSVTGTYMRDQDAIVVIGQYDVQNAGEWPTEIYGVVCDEDGEFDNGPGLTAGFNWEP